MVNFMSRLTVYLGKIKNRNAGDFYTSTVADEMGSIDSLMGGLSMAVGGIAAISPGGRHRDHEHHAGVRHGEDPRDRYQKGARCKDPGCPDPVPDRVRDPVRSGRNHRRSSRCESRDGRRCGAWTPVVIKPGIILLAVSFSAVVGIFFGIYPASKAAKADPIDA